jgi:hypothetical protein
MTLKLSRTGHAFTDMSRSQTAESLELLWRCRGLAQGKADSMQTHTHVAATAPKAAARNDEQLIGAEITFGTTLIGHVEGVIRDPLSQRVRRLITSYGLSGRRVAVPMEWVVKRSASRLVLAVGTRSLDDLGERAFADPRKELS